MRRHKHLRSLAGSGWSGSRRHVGLLHRTWLARVLLAHWGGVCVRHHGVPGLESIAGSHVSVFKIVCHQTRHVVHRFVNLPPSASMLFIFRLRVLTSRKPWINGGRPNSVTPAVGSFDTGRYASCGSMALCCCFAFWFLLMRGDWFGFV